MSSVKMVGFNEALSNIKYLGRKGKRVRNGAIKSGGKVVKKTMKKEVSVSDKNHLHIRDDIEESRIRKKDGIPHVDVGPKETAWRAKFLEFGTRKMPPNPFISRSEKLSANEVKTTIERELKKGLGL